MKIRMEIDEVNGKAFNIELPDYLYDKIREFLLSTKNKKGD